MTKIIPNKCINLTKIIDEDPDKYIFLSEIFLQKDMVIKVTKHKYNYNSYKIYKKLQNHEFFNIIPIYGYMKCSDNFKQLKLKFMTEGICTEKDNDTLSLLVMKKVETTHMKCTNIQLASAFFQLIITSLILYS